MLTNGLPMPETICDLTFAETLFIARAFTVKRLHTLPGPSAPEHRQRGFSGNVVSFPQNSATIFATLPRHPDEAAELLTVFFPAAGQEQFSNTRPYSVRRQRVLEALAWLQLRNPFFADITIDHHVLSLLPVSGVPHQFGVVAGDTDILGAGNGPAAAILTGSEEGLMPRELWKHAVPEASSNVSADSAPAEEYDVHVPHGQEPLSSYDLGYFVFCFPHLFPYGDGVSGGARRVRLPEKLWGRHLLLRGDRSAKQHAWSLDIDFLSGLFGVIHQRDLLRAVHVRVHSPSFAQQSDDMAALLETNFDQVARVLREHGGMVDALRDSSVFLSPGPVPPRVFFCCGCYCFCCLVVWSYKEVLT